MINPKPPFPYPKPKPLRLLKGKTAMTIGIGVLCSTRPRPYEPRPDAIIIVADTMGSTDFDSTDELHKLYFDEAAKVHITSAGSVEMAAELVPMLIENIKGLPKRSHGAIWGALSLSVHGHRVQHFMWDVLAPKYSFLRPTPEGPSLPIRSEDEPKVVEEWQLFDVGTDLLLGTFGDDGQALLYLIGKQSNQDGLVHLQQFPGHAAIGAGAYNAQFWLNYRGQSLGWSIKQSAYHAYEAKVMAAKAPTVNEDIEIIIATSEKSWYLNKETPEREGCEISLLEMKRMFKRYGPRNTFSLGHRLTQPPSSDSQTSKDQQ